MGKRTKLREAQRRELELRADALFKRHLRRAKRETRRHPPARYLDFSPQYRDQIELLDGYALREPKDWRCRIKSQSDAKRFIDLVRFCFAHYRVPAHLERVWLDPVEDDFINKVTPPDRPANGRAGAADLRRWYLVAAQGGSLYKLQAHPYLSKQETHHFLTAPDAVGSARRALWYAVARAQTDRAEVALMVSESKVANYSIASTYWKEVARFFARHAIAINEMDDLVDFLFAIKRENRAFTLKGRTVASLTRMMEDWHQALRRRNQAIGRCTWPGSPLPDVEYQTGKDDTWAIWRVRQIKDSNELFREGERMHHCVASYQTACRRGDVSIWSLTPEFPIGRVNRGVTLEVTRDGRIMQCRGFANRPPLANEVVMAKRWAQDHALTWASRER